MARFERGNDATAARKLARSEPLSGRNSRSDVTPRLSHIEKLKPGDDPTDAINRLYSVGRRTYGQPMPDAPRERTPHHQAPQPDWSSERATYAIGKNADVPLFVEHCEAVAAEIDVKLRWLGEQARRGRSVWSGALPGRHVMLEVACEPSVVGSL